MASMSNGNRYAAPGSTCSLPSFPGQANEHSGKPIYQQINQGPPLSSLINTLLFLDVQNATMALALNYVVNCFVELAVRVPQVSN